MHSLVPWQSHAKRKVYAVRRHDRSLCIKRGSPGLLLCKHQSTETCSLGSQPTVFSVLICKLFKIMRCSCSKSAMNFVHLKPVHEQGVNTTRKMQGLCTSSTGPHQRVLLCRQIDQKARGSHHVGGKPTVSQSGSFQRLAQQVHQAIHGSCVLQFWYLDIPLVGLA